ncbi:DHA1 family bicyclomycin/chloramphenicol resistance-like MFS transporter [Sphingomonas kyeonggiensis]|uniref:Bcr/CflA family efflux transporter n=1 Tax=Sphingomonas kyeonggiensis TaxID=1268553 RepID=A0A7W7NRT0_9SPHN|nr:multidrug effflux MFS transporter [Sphingomonas kyeonggiensis]MBB4839223.1 DHA1 family bicyclomycin/chloramphenicol resistance-like MFS transporter [Sphingomonas kyeonggiensis]
MAAVLLAKDRDMTMQVTSPSITLPSEAASTARNPLRILAVLATLMAFGSISTDLYLPAMPAMAIDLHSGPGALELTVSTYLVGFSLGQLFWGAVSDQIGRRIPVAIGIALFMIGSAGCALSSSVPEVIAWRLVQATGASAGVVLSRAMVRDLFAGDRAAQMLSTLITIMAVAPLVGPLIGGQLLSIGSWHLIFWLLVGIGAITMAALFTVPETLASERRDANAVRHALSRYVALLGDRRILAAAGVGGFFYAGAFAYIAGSPDAYIRVHHVSPQLYGLLFGLAILAIMLMNMLNARLVPRIGMDRLIRSGAVIAAIAGLASAVAGYTGFGGLAGLALPLILFSGMNGLIVANSIAGALDAFPERAGAASALIGAFQYGGGILGSALVSLLADGTPGPLGLVMALTGAACLLCTWLLPRTART